MSRRAILVLIVCAAPASACCGDSIDAIEFNLTSPGGSDRDSLIVGDTVTVWAGAIAGTGWPSCVRYVSRGTPNFTWPVEPARFVFRSSDTTVAAFGLNGLLRGLQAGETLLTASSGGATSRPLLLTVLSGGGP